MRPQGTGAGARLYRQAVRGLADDFEIADDGIADHPLRHEGLAATGDISLDGLDAIQDMAEVRPIRLHNSRASNSTKGRKCGLRLRSMTRSIGRPSSRSSSSARAR